MDALPPPAAVAPVYKGMELETQLSRLSTASLPDYADPPEYAGHPNENATADAGIYAEPACMPTSEDAAIDDMDAGNAAPADALAH